MATARVRPRWGAVAVEALIIVAGVVLYFGVRGLVDAREDQAHLNAAALVDLEKTLGIWVEGALQEAVVDSPALLTVLNWIYIWGHWPVIVAVLLWLVLAHAEQYRVIRTAMMLSGLGGVTIFLLFPMAPPRLAELGLVDTVSEYSSSYRVLQPPGFVAQYAAMPSLHVGWDLLMGISLVACSSHLVLRVLGVLLPAAMTVAVVLTANHYVLDVVAGVALVLVSLSVARLISGPRVPGHLPRPRAAPSLERRSAQASTTPGRCGGSDGR